ncbi:hypothetical protein ACFLWU_03575 [Chloroflexota bacterium]
MYNAVIPLVSCLISLIFTLLVLDQYLTRRKPYQLIWAIGLFMYFVSTGTEFWVGTWGLNQVIYRTWYLSGAIFVAAYLGMGTLYLLVRRRIAHSIMVILLISSCYATVRVLTASIDLGTLDTLSGIAMPSGIRIMTPFFNTFGTLALFGGAIYSALVFWRRRVMPHRVVSNILIAAGAVLPAFGGLHIRLGGAINLFYIFELLGIIIIFTGFLRSREVFGIYRFPLIHGVKKVPIS